MERRDIKQKKERLEDLENPSVYLDYKNVAIWSGHFQESVLWRESQERGATALY